MPTIEQLAERYRKYSDEELMDVYAQIDGYSPEAKAGLELVLHEHGGIDVIKGRINKMQEIDNEIRNVRVEIARFIAEGKDKLEIKSLITINYITLIQLDKLIEETTINLELEKADLKIKPRTIIGGIIGGAIGGTIGGILWGIQMIYSQHVFMIFLLGLALLSYGFIRLFTKQSRKNIIVLIITVISVMYAVALGGILYDIFGYQGVR
jgi:hypothetical protein